MLPVPRGTVIAFVPRLHWECLRAGITSDFGLCLWMQSTAPGTLALTRCELHALIRGGASLGRRAQAALPITLLTMSSRMSTFICNKLFSSSSCWFRFRRRRASLWSTPPLTPASGGETGAAVTRTASARRPARPHARKPAHLLSNGRFQTSGFVQPGS